MKTSSVVRSGTLAVLCMVSLAAVACRHSDAKLNIGAAPVPGQAKDTPAAADPPWHYEGEHGPAHWGAISPKFASCSSGRAQSPIDIAAPEQPAAAETVVLQVPATSLRIVHQEHVADSINNGHTIQVNYSEGDTLAVGGTAYRLVQYHFHAPSEHTVNGMPFPMEMHLVHTNAAGKLAVIGVLISEGAHNAAFDPIWGNLPAQKGTEKHLEHVKVDVDALLPAARTIYRYDGSLTTPPCSEGVRWLVMTAPISMSKQQIETFTALFHGNARPVQPLNGRVVLTDRIR